MLTVQSSSTRWSSKAFITLELELYNYVNWFNKHRIHGPLGYMTPVQYCQAALKKVV
ncbi:IS3 family transposase [Paenibacillus aquistagni]|uniref:IS3 family transposase n=1 Tax=Paenibacillus aquistagni TaxID=1852522 RepID=UPI001132275F